MTEDEPRNTHYLMGCLMREVAQLNGVLQAWRRDAGGETQTGVAYAGNMLDTREQVGRCMLLLERVARACGIDPQQARDHEERRGHSYAQDEAGKESSAP